jgi:hypothetical protein
MGYFFAVLLGHYIFKGVIYIMRKIKELLADTEKVWVYLGEDSSLKSAF